MNADSRTTDFYAQYAADLTDANESRHSAMLPHILCEVAVGTTVLDVGAGSGRDVAAMLAAGLEAFGVEPNEAMREQALARHPTLHGRLRSAALPELGRPFHDLQPDGFDAVVCSAVLMHLSDDELPHALAQLVGQLRTAGPGGAATALLVSLPEMDAKRLTRDRDPDGRRFFNHAPARVCELLSRSGMVLRHASNSDAVIESAGTRWHTLTFVHGG